ncbi:MAG: bacterioferritin [Actinomycetota bacterium]|nr:bacterioferritin [Actinomycetota bacterium]
MQGNPAVLEVLNDVLTAELTAINQYFVDAKMCANWGYDHLAEHIRADSIDEMKDAEMLVDRILYLDGIPNLQRLGQVMVGETVVEKLTLALELETAAIARLQAGVELCEQVSDNGSRQLLERILAGEEEHADWLETQLELVRQLGEPFYLSQQVRAS